MPETCTACDPVISITVTCYNACECKCHEKFRYRSCDAPGCKSNATKKVACGEVSRFTCEECIDWSVKWVTKAGRAMMRNGPFDIDRLMEKMEPRDKGTDSV